MIWTSLRDGPPKESTPASQEVPPGLRKVQGAQDKGLQPATETTLGMCNQILKRRIVRRSATDL